MNRLIEYVTPEILQATLRKLWLFPNYLYPLLAFHDFFFLVHLWCDITIVTPLRL